MDRTLDGAMFQGNQTIGGAAGAGIHHPKAVLQLLTDRYMGVAEEENVGSRVSGIRDCKLVSLLNVPEVAVTEQDGNPVACDSLF